MWQYIGAGILLAGSAWQDGKDKKISLWWMVFHMAAGVIGHFICKDISWGILAAMAPGAFFLCMAWLTKQRIGTGDGMMITALGAYVGFWNTVTVLMGAFIGSSLYGVGLLSRKKASIHKKIAFTPFVLGSFLLFFIGMGGDINA